MAVRKTPLAGVPVAVAPMKGDTDALGMRAGLLKVLLKAGVRVRDFDSANRVLVGHRRAGAGTSTDLYGLYVDVMRAAPSTVGGFVLWPEVVELRSLTVKAGGEPVFDPAAVEAWRAALAAYETERTATLARFAADRDRYAREFEANWLQYQQDRNLLQEFADGKDGPEERRAYRQVQGDSLAAGRRLEAARPEALADLMAATERKPTTLELTAARVRLVLADARSGEVVGVHEITAEANSVEAVVGQIADSAAKALGARK